MKIAVLDNGEVRQHGPLDDLRRAWKRASQDERRRFLEEEAADAPQTPTGSAAPR